MPLTDLFLRKTAASATTETELGGHRLKRTLGAFDLTMLGIGAIIGAGLFSSISDMVTGTEKTLGAGPGVMISYLLTAVACGFAALCYAEIAAMVPISGSAYSYSYVAFGEVIAWIIGWDLIIEYAIGNIYVAQKWGSYFLGLIHGLLGLKLPVWMTMDWQSATTAVEKAAATAADVAATAAAKADAQGVIDTWASVPRVSVPWAGEMLLSINLPAAAITILLTILLYVGVKESSRTNAAMVILKLALIGAFIGIGVFYVDPRNWHPFAPNGFTGIWHGAALGFFSYIGFDAVSTAAEETRNPQTDLPRGMIWSLIICTVLYIATAAVLTGLIPTTDLKLDDPLAEAFNRIGLTGVSTAIAFGAVVAMTAVLLVFQLGQTRIFYVMARDGLLPKVFAKVHPQHRTPHINTWVTGIFVAILCSLLTPDQAIGLTNIGTLFAFILVSVGVIVLRRREPDRPRPFRVPFYPWVPILSALACAGLILGLERSNWLRFAIWLAIGLVVYFSYGYRHSALRRRGS